MIPFHRVLISTAIVFCFGFAAWSGWAYARDGGWGSLVSAVAFGVAGAGLVVYLRNLRRFLGR